MADTVFATDEGIKLALQKLVASGSLLDTVKVRLYQNNITPSDASVIGDFTEATFTGYAAVTLSAATWGAVSVASHVASSAYGASPSFTRGTSGAAANLYGWYITDSGNTKAYFAARFTSAPLTVTNAGDSIQIQNLTATVQSVN